MKKCTTCQELKDESDFYSNKNSCKKCIINKVKENYAKNREKIIEKRLEYYHKNKERILLKTKEYQEKNKEKIRAYKYAYRRISENRYKARADWHNRRARKRRCKDSFTDEQWRVICARYNYTCLCCGIKAEDTPEGTLTIDHVIPLSRGGSNSIGNIQPLCSLCNSKKGQRIIDYRQL